MKTILRIIVILLVAAVVAGAFSVAVSNTSFASGPTGEAGQPPVMTSTDGQSMPTREPSEGNASITGGLSGVMTTLAKVTVITIFVVLIQKAFSLLKHRRLISIQR